MNVNKRNNYQLTGSIHTLSLISLPVTDIDESIAPCFDTLSSRENLSYSKINANKLVGDLFSYDERHLARGVPLMMSLKQLLTRFWEVLA